MSLRRLLLSEAAATLEVLTISLLSIRYLLACSVHQAALPTDTTCLWTVCRACKMLDSLVLILLHVCSRLVVRQCPDTWQHALR